MTVFHPNPTEAATAVTLILSQIIRRMIQAVVRRVTCARGATIALTSARKIEVEHSMVVHV